MNEREPSANDGSRPYDVAYPEVFKQFMATGWIDTPQPTQAQPWADRRPPVE